MSVLHAVQTCKHGRLTLNDVHFTFSQLTVRIVRQKLATHFDLEEDVLNGDKYKSFIKATVHATVVRQTFLGCRQVSESDVIKSEQPPERVGRGYGAQSGQEGQVGWCGKDRLAQTWDGVSCTLFRLVATIDAST